MKIDRSFVTNFTQPLDAGFLEFEDDTLTSSSSLTETIGLYTKLIDATSGNVTITLPTAAGNMAAFIIKKIDSSANTVIIDGNSSETIDGDTTVTIYDQYNYIEIISDGTNWKIINEFVNQKW